MKLLYSYMWRLFAHISTLSKVVRIPFKIFSPANQWHRLVMPGRCFFLVFCFILFSLKDARPQSPEKSGAVSGNGTETISYPGKDQDGEISFNLSYKYIFRKQAYEYEKSKLPNFPIDHYPLVTYDLDYTSTPNIKIGDVLPSFLKSIAFQYVDESGKTKIGTIEEFSKGKLLILDFWATWCGPCIQSMEKWNTIANTLKDDIQVLGFMLDHNLRAQYFGLEKGWSMPIVFGPESYIINSFFFDRQVVSRMAWIKDGKLIAITDSKGYDLNTVKDVVGGKETNVPSNREWTYSQ